ncbi:hypothetical protein DPMN_182463 [Dreissena polymorpha]|uniref:Uncharacterized protein n=1 Tax=Dreissena polymorpha TaxID=45954 RepID=A0A9D4DFH8_DREPO|nr:hypothetical protein DPMN_182463 [Dreissena polymorpha]
MTKHLKQLLQAFPLHQHTAKWQHEQFRVITDNLPKEACVCIHDFSENYGCSEKHELQTTYFQRTEVTIHVSVIHRHSILEHDGVESTEENPVIRQDYLFVVSPDTPVLCPRGPQIS